MGARYPSHMWPMMRSDDEADKSDDKSECWGGSSNQHSAGFVLSQGEAKPRLQQNVRNESAQAKRPHPASRSDPTHAAAEGSRARPLNLVDHSLAGE